jgi:hypothetical protein
MNFERRAGCCPEPPAMSLSANEDLGLEDLGFEDLGFEDLGFGF